MHTETNGNFVVSMNGLDFLWIYYCSNLPNFESSFAAKYKYFLEIFCEL